LKHFITIQDHSKEEIVNLIDSAIKGKNQGFPKKLIGKKIALIFLNPSLRTRASFELGIQELGGHVLVLDPGKGMWNLEFDENVVMDADKPEHIKDAVKVLCKYVDAIAIRSFSKLENLQEDKQDKIINAFVKYSDKPIISMESCLYHPCQALADIMTIKEKFESVKGKKFVLTWAPHPKALPMAVPNSALLAASKIGMDVTLLSPKKYILDSEIIDKSIQNCKENDSEFLITDNLEHGYKDADVIYAKSWGSKDYYGEGDKENELRISLKNWTVDSKKMSLTNNAKFMHCLPVRRNVVVTDDVIDSSNSIVYGQAENRLHAQNALLIKLLGDQN